MQQTEQQIMHTFKSISSMVPSSGHDSRGRGSIIGGASLGIWQYWWILSIEIILFSSLQKLSIHRDRRAFKFRPYVTARPAIPMGRYMIIKQWYQFYEFVNQNSFPSCNIFSQNSSRHPPFFFFLLLLLLVSSSNILLRHESLLVFE